MGFMDLCWTLSTTYDLHSRGHIYTQGNEQGKDF